MKAIRIGAKQVGKGKPCFIIAEAGLNHNGKLALAKKMVDAAAAAGADAVKFQAFKAEDLATKETAVAAYAANNVGKRISQQQLLKKYELKPKEFRALKRYCDSRNIIFLATPHTGGEIAEFVGSLTPAFKVGSGDLTNTPFLEQLAGKGKPMLIATGMATMREVKEALKAIYKTGNREVVALHCTTAYPCAFKDVNLRAMQSMQRELNCLVGYSDHTLGIAVPVMAVALGARVIEKHFTLSRKMKGPDHRASLEPLQLKEMVECIRAAEAALGSNAKKPAAAELKMRPYIRKSVVAAKDIGKGTMVRAEMLCIKRPGTGLSPALLKKIVGRKAKRKIKKGSLLLLGDLL